MRRIAVSLGLCLSTMLYVGCDRGGGDEPPDGGPEALSVRIAAPAGPEILAIGPVPLTIEITGDPELVEVLADGTLVAAVLPPYAFVATPPDVDGAITYTVRVTGEGETQTSAPLTVRFDTTPPVLALPPDPTTRLGLRGASVVAVQADDLGPVDASSITVTIDEGPLAGISLPVAVHETDVGAFRLVAAQPTGAWPGAGGYVADATRMRVSLEGIRDLAGNMLPEGERALTYTVEPWRRTTGSAVGMAGVDGISLAVDDESRAAAVWNERASIGPYSVLARGEVDVGDGITFGADLPSAASAAPEIRMDAQGRPVVAWIANGIVRVVRGTAVATWEPLDTSANPRDGGGDPIPASAFSLALLADGTPLVALRSPAGTSLSLMKWSGTAFERFDPALLGIVPTPGQTMIDAFVLAIDGDDRPALATLGGGEIRFRRWTGSGWSSLAGAPQASGDAPAISGVVGATVAFVFDGALPVIAANVAADVRVVRATAAAPTAWSTLAAPARSGSTRARLVVDAMGRVLLGTLVDGTVRIDRYESATFVPFAAPLDVDALDFDFVLVTPPSIVPAAPPASRRLLDPDVAMTALVAYRDATRAHVTRASR